MLLAGIVAEYNPFHNGHKYHIEQTRNAGATHIVAVMSGNVVQRGDVSIMDKKFRTKAALLSGVDLVLELPAVYSCSSAERFAHGAVSILNALGCVDLLSFGSESGNLLNLTERVDEFEKEEHCAAIRHNLNSGVSYPKALSLSASLGPLNCPNDILGLEYLKAIKTVNSHIKPFAVRRFGAAHHSTEASESIASASQIRKLMAEELVSIRDYVPDECFNFIRDENKNFRSPALLSRLGATILYRFRSMSLQEIANIPDVSEGLENRIAKTASNAKDLDELYFGIKTKRYTLARIRRIILSGMIGLTSADQTDSPPYIRILGMNDRGAEILKKAKKGGSLPMLSSIMDISKLSRTAMRFSQIESNATDLFSLCCPTIQPSGLEYTRKPVII